MIATNIHHAIGLHVHQPPGDLALLIETSPREAGRILRCRVPRLHARPERAARHLDRVALGLGPAGQSADGRTGGV